MTAQKTEPKSQKTEPKSEQKGRPQTDERFIMIELSCKDKKCSPCTYPNCQRFVRETPKKKPFETRMTKMFEVRKPITSPQDMRERIILVELSCKDKKCSPCTYPNCQRFARESSQAAKKAPFKVKATEISKGEDVKSLLKR